VSGCRAPQIPAPRPPIHALPEPAFLDELRRLNGTPETVLENAELMQLLLPVLRADFALLETYVYTPKPLLDYPISAFGGLQDREVSYDELELSHYKCFLAIIFSCTQRDRFYYSPFPKNCIRLSANPLKL
jgi:medium-chain acyl-[acyl-carrier-protein] hydrolase